MAARPAPDAWDYDSFEAWLEDHRREWGPRGGIEDALIDSMALGFAQYLFWTEQAHTRAVTEASLEDHQRKERATWSPPRLDQAAALEQAARWPTGTTGASCGRCGRCGTSGATR